MNSETRALIDETRQLATWHLRDHDTDYPEFERTPAEQADILTALADALEASAVSSHANCDYGEGWEEGFTAGKSSAVSSPSEDERVWSCARCGHAPATHSMPDHPAFQCLYEPVLVAAVSPPPTITDDARATINAVLIERLPLWVPDTVIDSVRIDLLNSLTAALPPGGETNG